MIFTRGENEDKNLEPFVVPDENSDSDTQLVCGGCGLVLVRLKPTIELHRLIAQCPGCERYNKIS